MDNVTRLAREPLKLATAVLERESIALTTALAEDEAVGPEVLFVEPQRLDASPSRTRRVSVCRRHHVLCRSVTCPTMRRL
jgi:hypothetical protein